MGVNRIGNREAVVDSFLPSPTVTVSRRRRSHSLTHSLQLAGWLARSLARWKRRVGDWRLEGASFSRCRCRCRCVVVAVSRFDVAEVLTCCVVASWHRCRVCSQCPPPPAQCNAAQYKARKGTDKKCKATDVLEYRAPSTHFVPRW